LETSLEIYKFNGINTRHKIKLHKPSTKHTVYQRGVYYSNIKMYKKLLDVIAEFVSNKKCFLIQLKKYLCDKALYSLEEYLDT